MRTEAGVGEGERAEEDAVLLAPRTEEEARSQELGSLEHGKARTCTVPWGHQWGTAGHHLGFRSPWLLTAGTVW